MNAAKIIKKLDEYKSDFDLVQDSLEHDIQQFEKSGKTVKDLIGLLTNARIQAAEYTAAIDNSMISILENMVKDSELSAESLDVLRKCFSLPAKAPVPKPIIDGISTANKRTDLLCENFHYEDQDTPYSLVEDLAAVKFIDRSNMKHTAKIKILMDYFFHIAKESDRIAKDVRNELIGLAYQYIVLQKGGK